MGSHQRVKRARIGIAGSTGYSGQELLSLLRHHSHFQIKKLLGREENLEALRSELDLVFLCTPNEVSLELAPQLLSLGISVIDVSGAFRLKKHNYSKWYGFEHSNLKCLEKSEYSLIPFHKLRPIDGTQAKLIANPGCFATSVLLALIPALRSGLIDPSLITIDAKSGTTGAGRKAETRLLFSEVYGDFAPYKVGRHQHWPEIVEAVEIFTSAQINPVFITELLPVARGISSAVFLRWKDKPNLEGLEKAFRETYKEHEDVVVSRDLTTASLKSVVHTNKAQIVLSEAFGQPVIFSLIDNLQRGAAGQALQNANLLFSLPLNEGLHR